MSDSKLSKSVSGLLPGKPNLRVHGCRSYPSPIKPTQTMRAIISLLFLLALCEAAPSTRQQETRPFRAPRGVSIWELDQAINNAEELSEPPSWDGLMESYMTLTQGQQEWVSLEAALQWQQSYQEWMQSYMEWWHQSQTWGGYGGAGDTNGEENEEVEEDSEVEDNEEVEENEEAEELEDLEEDGGEEVKEVEEDGGKEVE